MLNKALIIFASLIVTSCGNPSSKHPTAQRLRMNIYTEPPTLDSRKATDTTSVNVINMLFEGLMRIEEDDSPHLAIAKEVSISDDGKIYRFVLRDAYWTNGDPVTTEDFVYAWRKVLDPTFPSLFADKLYPIENAFEIKAGTLPQDMLGVKVIDEKTLEVYLKYPAPYFLELTACPVYFPVHAKNDMLYPEWAAESGPQFISNGPFFLKSWDHESQICVEKNPNYWDADSVKLESMHLTMIDDLTTEFYMYEMNELDWAGFPLSNLPPDILPKLIEDGTAQNYQTTATYYYKLNTDSFPLQNINIRRALALSINRQDIVEHVTQAKQIPALSIVPPMTGWPTPYPFIEDNDQESARLHFNQGLEELGIEQNDFPKLTLSYNSNREHQKIAQAIQQQWNEVLGIKVELEHCDWKVYLSKVNKQNYQIARMGWVGDYKDPLTFLLPFQYRDNPDSGGHNETGWEHPDYTAYLEQSNYELDPQKRVEILEKAERLLISEMPIIPIFFVNCWYLKKPYVHDVFISSMGLTNFKKAYVTLD